jgi:hypothetical protein
VRTPGLYAGSKTDAETKAARNGMMTSAAAAHLHVWTCMCGDRTSRLDSMHGLCGLSRSGVVCRAAGAGRTAAVLADAFNCLQGSVELKLPEPKISAAYGLKPGSFNAAASDPDVTRHMNDCLADWCRQVCLPDLFPKIAVCTTGV